MKPFQKGVSLAPWSQTRIRRGVVPVGRPSEFHFHATHEIVLIEGHPGDAYIGHDICPYGAGEILCISARTVHSLLASRRESTVIVIHFSAEALHGFGEEVWNPNLRRNSSGLIYSAEDCADLRAHVYAAFEAWRDAESVVAGLRVQAALYSLLAGIAELDPKRSIRRSPHEAATPSSRRLLGLALDHIHEHRAEDIALADVATAVGLGREGFCRFFKRNTGMTFTAYLNETRLTQAARELATTDKGVLAIAVDAGYQNLSYFNRRFKQRFGRTPSQYRDWTDSGVETGF